MESVTYEVYISVAVTTQRTETEAALKDNSDVQYNNNRDVEIYTPVGLVSGGDT